MKRTICSVPLFSEALALTPRVSLATKKISLTVSLLACLAATAHSQQQTPQLLVHAAHCLIAKEFLPSPRPIKVTLGYFLDEKSYAPDKVVYVVSYAAPGRSNGLVFALFLKEHKGLQALDIQNNASFVLSKNGISGVAFVDPPLGGTWTQEHLASAIRQIEKRPRFTVALRDVSDVDPPIRCEAYTDPQPKK
jgi:hypothetical protein